MDQDQANDQQVQETVVVMGRDKAAKAQGQRPAGREEIVKLE